MLKHVFEFHSSEIIRSLLTLLDGPHGPKADKEDTRSNSLTIYLCKLIYHWIYFFANMLQCMLRHLQ